jgi:hypothetical protein
MKKYISIAIIVLLIAALPVSAMQVIDSETAHPERYYLSRDVGGATVYDVRQEETDEIEGSRKSVRKKVYDGYLIYSLFNDRVEMHWKRDSDAEPVKIAMCQLSAQVFSGGSWSSWIELDFSNESTEIIDYSSDGNPKSKYAAIYTQAAFGQDNYLGLLWQFGKGLKSKQDFYVDAPGKLVKLRWIVQAKQAALAANREDGRGLTFHADDYDGEKQYSSEDLGNGWERHTWVFEPGGNLCEDADERTAQERFAASAGLRVDPVLDVEEESTTITVSSGDDWELEFDSVIGDWRQDGEATDYLVYFTNFIKDDSDTFYYEDDATAENRIVLENTPSRFVLAITGEVGDTSGYDFIHYYTVYPSGHIFSDYSFTNNSAGALTVDLYNAGHFQFGSVTESVLYDADDTSPTYNTQYWYGATFADKDSLFYYVMDIDDSKAQQTKTFVTASRINYRNDMADQNIAIGDGYRSIGLLYIGGDSDNATDIERDGSIFVPAHRTAATIATGTAADDLVHPLTLDTDGLTSDGTLAIEASGHDITVEYSEATDPRVTFYNPLIQTSSDADALVGYWKLDDTDADTVIDNEVSGGAAGALAGGNTVGGIDTTDAIRGTALELDGTDDYINLSGALANLTSTDKFTLSFWFKPKFAYDVASYQRLFNIGSSNTNKLYGYYNYFVDAFDVYNDINDANDGYNFDHSYTTDNELQTWHHAMLSVDLTKDIVVFKINEEIHAYSITDNWSSAPDAFELGSLRSSSYGAYIFDEVRLYDGALIPYTAAMTGLSQSVDPHEAITFHAALDDETATSSEIGGATLTIDASGEVAGPYGTALSFNDNAKYVKAENVNVDMESGCVSFWFKSLAAFDDNTLHYILASDGTSGGGLQIYKYSDNVFRVIYSDATGGKHRLYYNDTTTVDDTWESWTHYCICWDLGETDFDMMNLYVNGEYVEHSASGGMSGTWEPGSNTTYYYGNNSTSGILEANGYIKDITFTNSSDPRVGHTWSIMGEEVYQPQLTVTGAGNRDIPVGPFGDGEWEIGQPNLSQWVITGDDGDGIPGFLIGDGQLQVVEGSTTITVYTDEWGIVFDEAVGGAISEWYPGYTTANCASPTYTLLNFGCDTGDDWRQINEASNSTLTLVSSSATKAVVKATGELTDVTGHDYEITYTIHPDGAIFVKYKYTNNTGSAVSWDYHNIMMVSTSGVNYTNNTGFADDDDTTPTYDDQRWFGQNSSDGFQSVYFWIRTITPDEALYTRYATYSDGSKYDRPSTGDPVEMVNGEYFAVNGILYIGGYETTKEDVENAFDGLEETYGGGGRGWLRMGFNPLLH